MRCNACWRELEARAVATTCGHLFCSEDASKILNSDSTCPLCQQMLSKSNMKAVDMKANDEWVNMIMAGVHPQSIMKSAYKGVIFWIGQKDVETQATMNKAMQMRKRFEEMQTKCVERVEQVHGAYQKAMKRVQQLERELESIKKDQAELQEKYTEKSRQKRKLEEMYESLRSQYEKVKRSTVAPAHNDRLKFNMSTPDTRAGQSHLAPDTPIRTSDMFPPFPEIGNGPGFLMLIGHRPQGTVWAFDPNQAHLSNEIPSSIQLEEILQTLSATC